MFVNECLFVLEVGRGRLANLYEGGWKTWRTNQVGCFANESSYYASHTADIHYSLDFNVRMIAVRRSPNMCIQSTSLFK